MDSERRAETLAWIGKAQQDLDAAALIAAHAGPETVGCYLCRQGQGMEKFLKAMLVLHGEVPPKTHDLAELHRRVAGAGEDPVLPIDDLALWTDYATAARYPGFGDPQAALDLPPMLAAAVDLAARVRARVDTVAVTR